MPAKSQYGRKSQARRTATSSTRKGKLIGAVKAAGKKPVTARSQSLKVSDPHLDLLYLVAKAQRNGAPISLEELNERLAIMAYRLPDNPYMKGAVLPPDEAAERSLLAYVKPQENKPEIVKKPPLGERFKNLMRHPIKSAKRLWDRYDAFRNPVRMVPVSGPTSSYSVVQRHSEKLKMVALNELPKFAKPLIVKKLLEPIRASKAGMAALDRNSAFEHGTQFRIPDEKLPLVQQLLVKKAAERKYEL